jgi:hypothetical protein
MYSSVSITAYATAQKDMGKAGENQYPKSRDKYE